MQDLQRANELAAELSTWLIESFRDLKPVYITNPRGAPISINVDREWVDSLLRGEHLVDFLQGVD